MYVNMEPYMENKWCKFFLNRVPVFVTKCSPACTILCCCSEKKITAKIHTFDLIIAILVNRHISIQNFEKDNTSYNYENTFGNVSIN